MKTYHIRIRATINAETLEDAELELHRRLGAWLVDKSIPMRDWGISAHLDGYGEYTDWCNCDETPAYRPA